MRQRYFGVAVAIAFCVLGLTAHVAEAADMPVSPTVSYADFSAIDAGLAANGIKARLYMVEYTTRPDSGQYGGTIFARNVGNKQLGSHWVPNDPRRRAPGPGDRYITYAIDGTELDANPGLDEGLVIGAIDSAMATWDDVSCSTIPIARLGVAPFDLGYVQYLLGLGGVPGWLADITHAGWLPLEFFVELFGDDAEYVIGVTFTFIWIDDGTGEPTDIDRNGKQDVAFREIYYNNHFLWSLDAPPWYELPIDVETIVLHETGHGLSQAHFGKMFVDASDREPPYPISHLHFAPRAVMNSVYWDTQRELLGSDVGGHCSIWGRWPQK